MQTVYKRRHAIGAGLALAAGSSIPMCAVAGRREEQPLTQERMRALGLYFSTPAYTSKTAPHRLTRAILARQEARGAHAGPPSFTEHVEEQFARMDPERTRRLLANWQEDELASLAQSYTDFSARLTSSSPARLMDVLALQLTPRQLGRMSQHFGFAPLYAAVTRLAPHKSFEFQLASNPNDRAPVPSSTFSGLNLPQPMAGSWSPMPFGDLGRYLDMTPRQMYDYLRVAPAVGLMSRTAAASLVAGYWGATLTGAFLTSYTVASNTLTPFLRWAFPNAWESLGRTIFRILESLGIDLSANFNGLNLDYQVAKVGEAQQLVAEVLQVPVDEAEYLKSTGGAGFGISYPWGYAAFDYPERHYTARFANTVFGGGPNNFWQCGVCAFP